MNKMLMSALLAATILAPGVASAEIVLRLGETTAPNHPQTMRDVRVAELMAEKTNGEVVIETFPAGQLGEATAQMESMMTGGQDMFGGTAVFAGEYQDDWKVLSLYFLFSSADHIAAFEQSDIFDEMNEKLIDATGVRALSVAAVRGPSAFISKDEITSVEDFGGKTVRIPSVEGYALSLEALGAVPTPVAWTETYMAFSQGIIDVVQSSLSGIKSERFTDHGKYIMNIGHNWEPTGLFISEASWEKLNEEQQAALMESIVTANAEFWAAAEAGEETLKAELVDLGAVIYEGDPTPWREAIIENLTPKLAEEDFFTIPDLYQRIADLDPAAQ